jgi:hypothetical protein
MISGIASPDFETTAGFVDQKASYDSQIDGLEKRLMELVKQLKAAKVAAYPGLMDGESYRRIEGQIQAVVKSLEDSMRTHNVGQDIRSRLGAAGAQLDIVDQKLAQASEMRRALAEGCTDPALNNAAQLRCETLAASADQYVLQGESLRQSERSLRMRQELAGHPAARERLAREKDEESRKILNALQTELPELERRVAEAKASGDEKRIKSAVYALVRHQSKLAIQKRDMAERDRKERDGGDGRWKR